MYGIYLPTFGLNFVVNVGKYIPYMEHIGMVLQHMPRNVSPFRLIRPYYIYGGDFHILLKLANVRTRKGAMNGGIEVSYMISMAVGGTFLEPKW